MALDRVPRLADQSGFIAHRAARLATTVGWTDSVAAMRPADASRAPAALAELVAAAVREYLRHGPAAPVLLVHTATAPNAVRHSLPSLPESVWADSVWHAWTAAAAIQAMYAPAHVTPRRSPAQHGNDATDVALHRAADHGDEHVIKFTDTAVDAFDSCGDPDLLTAAGLARELIPARDRRRFRSPLLIEIPARLHSRNRDHQELSGWQHVSGLRHLPA